MATGKSNFTPVWPHPMPQGLDLPDRRAQVDARNHGYKFVTYKSGRKGKKLIRPYPGYAKLNAKEQAELPESLRAVSSKDNRQVT